jgi:cysteine desulfurase/selenocysteine lyase
MMYEVDWEHATWRKPPHKFEAGTPAIVEAIGLQAAILYLQKHTPVLHDRIGYEAGLCRRLIEGLATMDHIRILGPQEQLKKEGHLVSFVVDSMHAHDVAAYLDKGGIAVRAGHHCAQPLAKKLGYTASVRASFYLYNEPGEVDSLLERLSTLPRTS